VRRPTLPTRVHKNISRAASRARSDFEVSNKIYRALSKRASKATNITHNEVVDTKIRPAPRPRAPAMPTPPRAPRGLVGVITKKGTLAPSKAHRVPTSTASKLDGRECSVGANKANVESSRAPARAPNRPSPAWGPLFVAQEAANNATPPAIIAKKPKLI
jgi:hypothetical protein